MFGIAQKDFPNLKDPFKSIIGITAHRRKQSFQNGCESAFKEGHTFQGQ